MGRLFLRVVGLLPCISLLALPLGAQEEERSISERFLYGGEITANVAPHDDGYFNHTDYDRNGLRLLRLNFSMQFEAVERLSFLTEIRSDNFDAPKPYALYVRIQPIRDRALFVQAGRIPPVFGAFSRRRYDYDNPLIGYPLAYQYRTLLRADAAPGGLPELRRHRGFGTKTRYSVGDTALASGLPIINPLRWDTGVEVKLGRDPVELAIALTQGSLSSPRVRDDNSGKQLAGRLALRPSFGWTLGVSGARGEYVSEELQREVGGEGESAGSMQSSVGLDSELARGHWIVRGEAIWTRWDAFGYAARPLDALAFMAETRYKLFPGLHVAARIDRLDFSELVSLEPRTEWDAPVHRLEVGFGYALTRRLLAKASLQWNERDGGSRRSAVLPAVQLIFWF